MITSGSSGASAGRPPPSVLPSTGAEARGAGSIVVVTPWCTASDGDRLGGAHPRALRLRAGRRAGVAGIDDDARQPAHAVVAHARMIRHDEHHVRIANALVGEVD